MGQQLTSPSLSRIPVSAVATILIGITGVYGYLSRLSRSGNRREERTRVQTRIFEGPGRDRRVSELLVPVSRFSAEQRRERRYLVELSATLRIATRTTLVVMIVDVSNMGLRVTCPEALPTGTQICIQVRGLELAGEVRYAREIDPGEFHLGIQTAAENGSALLQLLFPNAA